MAFGTAAVVLAVVGGTTFVVRSVTPTDSTPHVGAEPSEGPSTSLPAEPTTTLGGAEDAGEGTEGRGNPIGRPLTAERDKFADITSENPYGSSVVFTSLETAFADELDGSTLAAWLVELATPEKRFEAADYTLLDGSRFRLAWRDNIDGRVQTVGSTNLPGAPHDVRYYSVSAESGNFEVKWTTTEYEGMIGFYDGAAIPQHRELEDMVLRHYEAVIEQTRSSQGGPETFEALASRLRAEPISAEELERITGMGSHAAELGYRISQTFLDEPNAELGLIVYRDLLSGAEEGTVYTCFHDYAFIDGLSGVGGAHCAPTIEQAEQIAASDIAASRTCSLGDKDSPDYVDDAPWTLLTVWGVPNGVEAVDVGLGDGTTKSIYVSEKGIAQMIWADLGDIVSINFDGMSERHTAMASGLPYPGIDCGPDDGSGG